MYFCNIFFCKDSGYNDFDIISSTRFGVPCYEICKTGLFDAPFAVKDMVYDEESQEKKYHDDPTV